MEEGIVLLGVAFALGVIARDAVRTKRRLVCPLCGGRELTVVSWRRWHEERTGGARTEYRCAGCGESLFAELSTPRLMTRADHERWLEAMRHRDKHQPPPAARVHRKRRGWW